MRWKLTLADLQLIFYNHYVFQPPCKIFEWMLFFNWGNFVTSTFIVRLSTILNMYNMFWIISKSFVQWATLIPHYEWVIHGNTSKNISFLG
jgi:hypothetical protein